MEIRLGPEGKAVFQLSHFDRDLFTYRPYAEMPTMPFVVSFAIGSDQKATEVTLDDLNDLGLGLLKRTAELSTAVTGAPPQDARK